MANGREDSVEAGGFEALAEIYERVRPGYPEELLDFLLLKVGVRAGDPVADIGAGTGRLTKLLADRDLAVTALEPLEAMRDQGSHVTRACWTDGTFEKTGLDSCSQKWVVSAQAFHWAAAEIALPEIRRILQPQRYFTTIWNAENIGQEPILRETYAILQKHVPAYRHVIRASSYRRTLSRVFGRLPDTLQGVSTRVAALVGDPGRLSRGMLMLSSGDFHRITYRDFSHHMQVSREGYLDLFRSRNHLQSVAGPAAFERFIQELNQWLKADHIESVDVPYVCSAWTAQARDELR